VPNGVPIERTLLAGVALVVILGILAAFTSSLVIAAFAMGVLAGTIWAAIFFRTYHRKSPPQPGHSKTQEGDLLKDQIIDSLDRAVIVCGLDGIVKVANKQARELLKAPALEGKNLHHIALSSDIENVLDTAIATDVPVSREFDVDYPEPRSLRAKAFKVSETDVALWIADVSDIRRLETVRRDFVANVSHELRTPMASIRAMAETIEDDLEISDEERKAYLDKIIAEVDRLTLLSEDLLTLASAETRPAEPSEIDLAEIARYAVQQMQGQADAKGLSLEIDAPTTQPALGDKPQVIQVAMNLLQNAIRYTNVGGARVRVYEQAHDAVLEVSDTGIGIGKEHVPRIFERFYRVDAARSRATGGTGLGLAIVRHITEGLGGRVEVESELGRGSTFRVRLPL